MPRSTPRLVVYLLVPYLITVLPLLGMGYLVMRHAVESAAVEVAGAAGLQQARSIAAHVPRDLSAAALEARCRDEVRGSATRLTIIAASGDVLCDSEADPDRMVNHLDRPEVQAALATGVGVDRRKSATVHHPLLYAAIRAGEGRNARIVRVAIPAEFVARPDRQLATIALLGVIGTLLLAFLPALYAANRIGGRLERMVEFSRGVATGDFSTKLAVTQRDLLGILAANLNHMSSRLQGSFLELRAEGEKVGGILRAMVEGVVVVSVTGQVVLINQRAEAIFGLESGPDYRGRHLLEMCRDPELQQLLRSLPAWNKAEPAACEIALVDADRRFLAVSVSPIRDATSGPPTAFVMVFHDITDLKKLETMRRDFVANVSHELRTPLTAIRGYAETLLAGALEDRERARQFLSVIDRHSERLSRLIDDLLTLSDLELGKTALKKEAVHLETLVEEVVEVLRDKARRGGVGLVTHLPPELPLVLGDADRLQQVLINLTDNAIKYSANGGTVRISADAVLDGPNPMVELAVQDHGIGIPTSDLPRLTERFYRVDKARSRELGGTGLGLAIVKHIVQAHGGKLEIRSTLNVGTVVKFSVPSWSRQSEAASS
ncbi:MAG: PAS domain S-box protein [Deltaproteobacteria bacterium]|nr:PAS domain S-box protein [Deltaproteobacteria bacterium]